VRTWRIMGGEIVKRKVLAWAVVAALAGTAAAIAAGWPTGDVTASGLLILVAGLLASGLAAYFAWRTNLRRRILTDDRRAA
jgi:hypothetical protein